MEKFERNKKMKGREKKSRWLLRILGLAFSLRVASCDRDYTDESGSERGWIIWNWCGVVWV